MGAENNLIKSADLQRVREIDFVERFAESTGKLIDMLGITRIEPKEAGTVLKIYKATGQLVNDGTVAEGEIIPLSKYEVEGTPVGEMALKKWRKATSAEAISEKGYDQAVTMTEARMLKDVQAAIKNQFVSFLGEGTGVATGKGLQAALAAAWGQLQVKFEDNDIESVYIMNPLDVSDYLATADVSLQTAFGLSYIENFLGLGTVILTSAVTKGTFYATAKDNIVLYYLPVAGGAFDGAFEFTADSTGYIGVHEEPDYTNMTSSETVVSGINLFAERADGVIVGTITNEGA